MDYNKPVVIIDAGHGGNDPGMKSKYFLEKDINLKIEMYQFKRLKELNVPVALTRGSDITIEPVVRGSMVKNSGAKVCISNHINATTNTSVKGAETIHSIYSNGKLAKLILDNLVEAGMTRRRVFSRKNSSGKDYYYMHRYTGSVETVIVEYGFGTNEDDSLFIINNLERLAEAVVKALCSHLGYKYVGPINEVKEIKIILKKGSKGQNVFNMQSKLSKLNYKLGTVDGIFGSKTENAIRNFQKNNNLSVDGIAGPLTLKKLDEIYLSLNK